jgi:hypothetical protein
MSLSDLAFYKENGFYLYYDDKWAYYDLRPEVLEVTSFYSRTYLNDPFPQQIRVIFTHGVQQVTSR